MSRTRSILLLLLAVPLVCEGQSLGSVAKKEKERRDKNKQEGVAVRQIREDEVRTAEDETPEESAPESDSAGAGPEVEPSAPETIDVKLSAEEPKSIEKEQGDRRRSEAEWRARFQDARARAAAARERVAALEGLFLGQGGYYVDAEGRTVIGSVEELQRLNQEARAELEDAGKSLQDLEDEARRAGIPPGWLR
jgi:hypothetical protein